MKTLTSAVAVLTCMIGSSAFADDEPYLAAGQRLAEANCSRCHNVAPGGAFKLYPPSFTSIAVYMAPEMIRMRIMYPDHAVIMPQYNTYMFAENIDNLVGYIVSLEEAE